MTTRRLLLAALFAAALSAGGCTGYAEPLKAEEKPNAGEVPQAPPPHVKKTTAELLVGKWRKVKFFGKPLPPGDEGQLEFTKDGRFTFVTTTPSLGSQVKTGVYHVVGNTIRVTSEPTRKEPSKTWDIAIESITETELAMKSQQSAYTRVEK